MAGRRYWWEVNYRDASGVMKQHKFRKNTYRDAFDAALEKLGNVEIVYIFEAGLVTEEEDS